MTLKLVSAKVTPPDNDGDANFEVSFEFLNTAQKSVELLHTRLLIATPDGSPVGETEDDIEELIEPGDTGRASVSAYIPYPDGTEPVTASRLILTVVPMSCSYLDLGRLPIPDQDLGLSASHEERSCDQLRVTHWSCLRRRQDRDGDVTLQTSAWLAPPSDTILHRAVLKMEVLNYAGRPVTQSESRDDRLLFPRIPAVITDSLYCRASQLRNGRICASLRCYQPMETSSLEITSLQLGR